MILVHEKTIIPMINRKQSRVASMSHGENKVINVSALPYQSYFQGQQMPYKTWIRMIDFQFPLPLSFLFQELS